jgi:hypothetical protein
VKVGKHKSSAVLKGLVFVVALSCVLGCGGQDDIATTWSAEAKSPDARAKDYDLPSPNPTLFTYANKSVANLPKNLREVFEAVGKHAEGVALQSLKVGKMAPKYLHWLVRQLAKHEFLRVKAEEKPEPKKAVAKKEEK